MPRDCIWDSTQHYSWQLDKIFDVWSVQSEHQPIAKDGTFLQVKFCTSSTLKRSKVDMPHNKMITAIVIDIAYNINKKILAGRSYVLAIMIEADRPHWPPEKVPYQSSK